MGCRPYMREEKPTMSEREEAEDTSKWRFTWEAQSHNPTLKLFLFNSSTNPVIHCSDLRVNLNLLRSTIRVSYTANSQREVSILVPVPGALIDCESPVSFRALDDHIEVKLLLLLPVDHPAIPNLQSVLGFPEDGGESMVSDAPKLFSVESDVQELTSKGSVDFYCRSCSAKLTRSPISHFSYLPSVNWQDVAENWFGACCCSFGGISEKLVSRYAKSYAPSEGKCLLTSGAVIIYKDDILGCEFLKGDRSHKCEDQPLLANGNDSSENLMYCHGNNGSRAPLICDERLNPSQFVDESLAAELKCAAIGRNDNSSGLHCNVAALNLTNGCCLRPSNSLGCDDETNVSDASGNTCRHVNPATNLTLQTSQIYFLNGYLGDGLMARSHNLSTAIEWLEFACPQCSAHLGAYPCTDGCAPLDGGVRLYKCFVSTDSTIGGSSNVFKDYTLQRLFSNQIMESAKDDLSFRTIIRDLKTKSPALRIVLLNPNCWFSTGYCLGIEAPLEPCEKLVLHPAIKVLFEDCRSNKTSSSRMSDEWVTKHSADEMFMLTHQVEALIGDLVSAKDVLPPSMSSLQGLTLSLIHR